MPYFDQQKAMSYPFIPLSLYPSLSLRRAERERRAKIINAEDEYQAAAKLTEATVIISEHPMALQLRYLQTMREMSSEQNTTTIFPFPVDLFTPE
jgi:regulator of protease activity HflC (stomatin/prohibitin superfamily)